MDAEISTLKKLYEAVADKDSASYKSFVKKLARLQTDNPRTINAIKRRLGIPVAKKKQVVTGQFVAYDGEGYGNKYVLLANSLGERISNPDGLTTVECLTFLTTKYTVPTKRIFFAFGYDVNHILVDVPDDVLEVLLSSRQVEWEGYKLQYIPGKIFVVNNLRYFDTFGFFQTSYIKVVCMMLGPGTCKPNDDPNDPRRGHSIDCPVTPELIAGKEARGTFETWSLEKLTEYNDIELDLMVKIFDKLKQAFLDIDVDLKEWYGPGAVAKYWYKEHSVYPRERHTTGSLLALNGAYYGGRFEQISLGHIGPIYEYDIRSAYPAVMADMPYFTGWTRVRRYQDHPYAIWHVSFDLRDDYLKEPNLHGFLPLPMRSKDGRICFPLVGRGWYWSTELLNVLVSFPNAKLTFHEGYIATVEGQPFSWVRELYDYRRQLKADGNLAQYAIKVGINSLYGKTAQRIGSNDFFSLAWAGYTTASTRAKLANAAYSRPESIVGFATDALFSTRPLDLPISTNLGDWEETVFDSGTFYQSGVYRLVKGAEVSDRYRGSPLRRGIDDINDQLSIAPHEYPTVRIGRFISHLLALRAKSAYGPYRLQFVQVQHRLQFDAPYKRHYTGFIETIKPNGVVVSDYSRLLRMPIGSTPKVYVEDNNAFLTNEYLHGNIKFSNIESNPPPMKDSAAQALIDEGITSALDGGYDGISDLEVLPVVSEDEMM